MVNFYKCYFNDKDSLCYTFFLKKQFNFCRFFKLRFIALKNNNDYFNLNNFCQAFNYNIFVHNFEL